MIHLAARRWQSAVVSVLAIAVYLMLVASVPITNQAAAVGVQFHGIWADYSDADRLTILDTMAATGMTRVRIDASWAQLQPDGPFTYSAAGVNLLSQVVTEATQRGLRPLITLWLTPEWAARPGASPRSLPTDPQNYAHVAAWAATRWAGEVDWELWNEPNSNTFATGADPVAYAQLVKAAYPAIKRADPNTTVVAGAVEYNDDDWLSKAYAAGLGGNFDALATHPYQSPSNLPPDSPENGSIWRLAHVAAVRRLMIAHGDSSKPIWFTELGWSTIQGGSRPWEQAVTPATQALYLTQAVQLIRAEMPYVRVIFIYEARDGATLTREPDGYGLMTHDLRPKPAVAALARLLLAE